MSSFLNNSLYSFLDLQSELKVCLAAVAFCLLSSLNLYAQEANIDFVIVNEIIIKGNKKTKGNVILRELNFHRGDTLQMSNLAKRLTKNEQRLQSIGLFILVKVNIKDWNLDSNRADIEITVRENWYIYPYLIAELADRNFNVWRREFNYSLDRVNYGLAINHINLTGHKDKLRVKWQSGFTRKYEVAYDYPYWNGRWGVSTNFLYTENREMAYRTRFNKPLFYKAADERKLYNSYRASVGVSNRSNAIITQSLRFEYIQTSVDSFVTQTLNPSYFNDQKSAVKYFALDYNLKFDNTKYPLYPSKGLRFDFTVRKDGIGIFNDVNNLTLAFTTEHYTSLTDRLFISSRVKFKTNLSNNPVPYFLNNSIGYKRDVITGYQLYTLDGKDFMLINNSVHYRILEKTYTLKSWMPKVLQMMDAKLFGRVNFDYGYSRDPYHGTDNSYVNSNQYGYGAALDLIIYNNLTFTLELGITRHGEKGLFYSSQVNF